MKKKCKVLTGTAPCIFVINAVIIGWLAAISPLMLGFNFVK